MSTQSPRASASRQSAPGPASAPGRSPASRGVGLVLSFATWLALWALLSSSQGWEFGVPLALLAAWAGWRANLHVEPLYLRYLPAFIGFFLIELCLGGWDVARRAWHPQLPIEPGWVCYEMETTEPRARLLLSALVGLFPGTLASHTEGHTLHLHALDHRQDWHGTVARLEKHLDRLLRGPRP